MLKKTDSVPWKILFQEIVNEGPNSANLWVKN
jgi:hypothetical protein